MLSIIPYYKAERRAIIIRIIIGRDVAKAVSTGIKIDPEQWNDKERKVIKHPNHKLLNHKISAKVSELQNQFTKAELLGVHLTKDRVKKIAEGNVITTDFYSHCERWILEKYTNPATKNQMLSELRKVKQYAPSLQFGDIDKRWLMNYHRFLLSKYHGNTPWKSLKFIRTMIYDAQSIGGIVIHNPFQTREYKMPKYIQPEKDGLYIEELDRIEALLDQSHPIIIKIMAAKFLFMCYTGLRISDAKRVTADHFKNNRLVITSKKTGITTSLKLHKRLSKLLARDLPNKSIADQKMNEYLKIIAGLAKIDRITLTNHVGRHTFGCLLAEMGASREEAKELMGIVSRNVVDVYFRLRQPQIDRAADRLNNI